jgi:ABC-2 type transport system ATP-binding protein
VDAAPTDASLSPTLRREQHGTMTTSESVVEVSALRKAYRGGFEALRGIDFTIERGETFALLGPNGAGKSTTIEILEGYRDRTGGDALVLGTDPQRGGLDWKARLGIVLQSSGEQGNATVREQLAHFARFYPNPRDVDEVIAAVGLEEKARTRIKKLSGGQRRRVDVALGIIGNPELLFLDEPTTGFDPEARRQFWDLIRGLKRDGTTILLTTHYLDEAAQLSDRAGIIAGGRLVALGAIDEIGGAEARVPIVRWVEDGILREQRTETPGEFVARLSATGEPGRLEVVRPSLEDIYLGLVDAMDATADDTEAVAA